MKLARSLGSYTFRFVSIYVIALSVAVFVLQTVVYANYSYLFFKSVHDSVAEELAQLVEVYRHDGASAAQNLIDQQLSGASPSPYLYLIVDAQNQKLAGNVDTWPSYRLYDWHWFSFDLSLLVQTPEPQKADYVAQVTTLDDGERALVARDFQEARRGASLVGSAIVRSMIVTMVLGIIGGVIVAVKSAGQLDTINRSVNRIMAGDLSERLDVSLFQGEYHQLSIHLNTMLERIQALMKGVRQLSDNIAHDLRTPLTRLRNKLVQLKDDGTSSEDDVQALIDEADNLLSTFSAILRITQVESGNRRSEFCMLDPKVILLDVIELYEPVAQEKPLSMIVKLQDGLKISGDRHLLFQSIANLLDNAIKYTGPNGSVHVELSGCDQGIMVSVADSGIGIPEHDYEKVFKRFYRVESSRGTQPGNGLGLSLVRAVVNLHGGSIALANNHPGLIVKIMLPAA